MHELSLKTLQAVCQIASSLLLSEAAEILDSLDPRYCESLVFNPCERVSKGTPLKAFIADKDYYYRMVDSIGPIAFWGGPVTLEWYTGRVSNYVADCILHSITEIGYTPVFNILTDYLEIGAP